jgi:hypothetical protein
MSLFSKEFSFSMSSRLALGPTQPPIHYKSGAFFPELKRPGREAEHSHPFAAEFKEMWIYTSAFPYVFMV